MGRIAIREGDLTAQDDVEAIVNAANAGLVLGSGVAGAIRERGGASIAAACEALAPIEVGAAVATAAGELPVRHILHAAVMPLGGGATEDSVRQAMRSALALAEQLGCRRIAVPALGAGAGGLAMQRSAEILLDEARRHLAAGGGLEEIRFVVWGEPAMRIFEAVNDALRIAEQMARLGE